MRKQRLNFAGEAFKRRKASDAAASPLQRQTQTMTQARVFLALMALSSLGCSTNADRGTPAEPGSDVDPIELLRKLKAWESEPVTTHAVSLMDGTVKLSVESKSVPETECETSESLDYTCTIGMEFGEDALGDKHQMACVISKGILPFGTALKAMQGEFGLTEVPAFVAEKHEAGLTVSFVADAAYEDDTSFMIRTLKIKALYAKGFVAQCFDPNPGGRETFERVTAGVFDSLQVDDGAHAPMFAMGYRMREGDRTTGFRYRRLSPGKKEEDGKLVETGIYFSLETDEKTWSIYDSGQRIARDKAGKVDEFRSLSWFDGQGPLVVSAKPSEDGRYRIKTEAGNRSDAIELTPKVPISSELWSAGPLAQLATGKQGSFVYAEPTVDGGDPSLTYIFLTAEDDGLVLEAQRNHGAFDKEDTGADSTRDELHIDDSGFVTKEVTNHSVHELVFQTGALPTVPKPAAAKSRSKRRRRSKR